MTWIPNSYQGNYHRICQNRYKGNWPFGYCKNVAANGQKELRTTNGQNTNECAKYDYGICYVEGYIDTSPCDLVKIPKGLKETKRELPEQDQINRVKNGLDCHFGLFAYFLLCTGLRRGEALAIEWKDIDLKIIL